MQCFSPLPALDSWCGLSSGCFFHTVSCLLGYWFIGLVETPALPPCSYSYISPGMWTPYTLCLATPLAHFPQWGPGAEMDGEAEHSPPDGLIYGVSFRCRQYRDPWGWVWRALGTAAVSDLTAPGSQSTLMPSTKRPLQNGRNPSCRQRRIFLKSKNIESRNNETCSLPPSPLPTDIDLHCNNLLYHIWLLSGGCLETLPRFFPTSINIATLQAAERNHFCTVVTAYGYSDLNPELCSTETALQ